jgi:hypothetical protein
MINGCHLKHKQDYFLNVTVLIDVNLANCSDIPGMGHPTKIAKYIYDAAWLN